MEKVQKYHSEQINKNNKIFERLANDLSANTRILINVEKKIMQIRPADEAISSTNKRIPDLSPIKPKVDKKRNRNTSVDSVVVEPMNSKKQLTNNAEKSSDKDGSLEEAAMEEDEYSETKNDESSSNSKKNSISLRNKKTNIENQINSNCVGEKPKRKYMTARVKAKMDEEDEFKKAQNFFKSNPTILNQFNEFSKKQQISTPINDGNIKKSSLRSARSTSAKGDSRQSKFNYTQLNERSNLFYSRSVARGVKRNNTELLEKNRNKRKCI